MSFDSTGEQEQQDRQDALDMYRVSEWRSLIATMPNANEKLTAFHEACADIAGQFAAGRFAKPTGVDQLIDMAQVCGLTEAIGLPETERTIGEAFTKAEQDKAKKKPDAFTYVDIRNSLDKFPWDRTARLPLRGRAPRAHHRGIPMRCSLPRAEGGASGVSTTRRRELDHLRQCDAARLDEHMSADRDRRETARRRPL
jgi:hypothetical protein